MDSIYNFTNMDLRDQRLRIIINEGYLFLGLFGIAHIFLLWAGDILLPYSIAGFILFLFRKQSTKLLLLVGFLSYFFISFWQIVVIWIPLPSGMSSTCTECLTDALQIYPVSNYVECLKLRLMEYYAFRYNNMLYYFPKILGVFIFGYLASKYTLHKRIQENRSKWFFVFLISGSIRPCNVLIL